MIDYDDTQFHVAMQRLANVRLSEEAKQRHLAMLAQITSDPAAAAPLRRNRRRSAILAAAAVIMVSSAGFGTAAALGAFVEEPPTDRQIVRCYTTAGLSENANFEEIAVAASEGATNSGPRHKASSALELCREGWRKGRYSIANPEVEPSPPPPLWNYPVPPLTACVLASERGQHYPELNLGAALIVIRV